MASADLGGLGAFDSPPLSYHWTRPSPLPVLLPWMVLLGLLLLPFNRSGQAWWIWAPVLVLEGLASLSSTTLSFLPSSIVNGLLEPIGLLALGLAVGALLSPWAESARRWVSGLRFGGMLLAGSALAWLCQWSGNDSFDQEWVTSAILGGIGILVIPGTFFLTSRFSGGGRNGAWLALALVLSLLVSALAVVGPFFLIMSAASNSHPSLWQMLIGVLVVGGLCALVMAPFVILTLANPFYRERCKALLLLGARTPPALSPEIPPVVIPTAPTGV